MTDHLEEAHEFVACAENFSSPDDRSIPFALHGILHALIAIAERMPRPATPEEFAEYVSAYAGASAEALSGYVSVGRVEPEPEADR